MEIWCNTKTICNYFKKGGFSNQIDDINSDEDVFLAYSKEKWKTVEGNGKITNDVIISDFLEVDIKLLTALYPTDEEILNILMDNNKGQKSDSNSKYKDMIRWKPHQTAICCNYSKLLKGFQEE